MSWLNFKSNILFHNRGKPYRLGMTLSGGAARGFAHIGVLQAFAEAGIHIDCVSGSSVGAVMALFFAAGKTPKEMLDIARQIKSYRLKMTLGPLHVGTTGLDYLEQLIKTHVQAVKFSELQKPLHVCVTNMHSGLYEIFSEGDIVPAIRASCAIPVRYDDQIINGISYVDGGLRNNLPVEPLLECCRTVVGVSVNPLTYRQERFGLKQTLMRIIEITLNENEIRRIAMCHYHMEIAGLENFELEEYDKIDEIYALGYFSARQYLVEHPALCNL